MINDDTLQKPTSSEGSALHRTDFKSTNMFTAGNGWDNHQGNFNDTGGYDPRQMPGFWHQGQQQVSQGSSAKRLQSHRGRNVEFTVVGMCWSTVNYSNAPHMMNITTGRHRYVHYRA